MISTIEKPLAKAGSIAIRAYFDPTVSNMGLEKYGLSLWDGVFHEEQLVMIDDGINRRYITGLNDQDPEVRKLPDELRNARILEIRKTVADLEMRVAHNKIPAKAIQDIEDKEPKQFWEYVKKFRPDNDDLWSKITLRVGNEPLFLDPNDPDDLVKLCAIEAGGFSLVAPSYEAARGKAVPPKFYLDRYEETASTVTELKKLVNRSTAELQNLYDTNQSKLLYVAKVTDMNSVQYKKTTPADVIYDNMDRYIHGEGVEKNKKRAAQFFLDNTRQDMETLKLRSLVKDATFYKFIQLKSDGFIYHTKSGELLGKTPHDVVEHLKNPLHDQTLNTLMREVEKLW